MKDKNELRKVPIEYLCSGLLLLDDLYNYNGKVLLLPKGETLSDNMLQKLMKFESGNKYITTYESTYNKIMEKVPAVSQDKITKEAVEKDYNQLQKGVEDILRMAQNVKKLSEQTVAKAVQQVGETLAEMDTVAVFHCVEMPRPMDDELQRHSLNVALLNGMMGAWLELSKEEIKLLVTAGILHDIGKTKISEEILNAPRRLTKEEFDIVKKHTVYSREMLGDEFDEKVKTAVLYHHEKTDGSGYPFGLQEEQIPLFARITAITDIYDAMVSKRSYKEERVMFDILESFYEKHYQGLDEQLTALFLKNMRKQFLGKKVLMSDGKWGIVKFIPPNDLEHPVIEAENLICQTDEGWYCVSVI